MRNLLKYIKNWIVFRNTELKFPKEVESILKKPYHWVLIPEQFGNYDGWVAYIEEFTGCCTCGDTKEQALYMLQDCAELWLDSCLEEGLEIPDPIKDDFMNLED
jgi:antitoxin HicB